MSNKTAVNVSPFNCRWIVQGSAHHVGDWSYAICVRNFNAERLVNESECAHCPRWEEPDDLAERRAALAWNSVTIPERAVTVMKASTQIGLPVVQVFRAFTDVERAPERVSAIRKVEMQTRGGVRLGARWRETRQMPGLVDDGDREVTSFDENRTYTITQHHDGVRIDTTFWFTPAPGGTKVVVELAFGGGELLPGVAEALKQDLADLKRSLES